MGTSYVNVAEANQVSELVTKIIEAGIEPRRVTVLTLYDEQRRNISEKLQSKTESKVMQVYFYF
jgi:superfamily I DNA and/or RNA helicase